MVYKIPEMSLNKEFIGIILPRVLWVPGNSLIHLQDVTVKLVNIKHNSITL